MKKLAIMIACKDRPTELALLLQSLRTQTFQDFDIFIADDQSGTPFYNYHFFNCLLTRLRQEGHIVYLIRTEFPHGVSKIRQRLVDEVLKIGEYEFMCRLDDDVILEPDYISRLFGVIEAGYDLASGVTVPMSTPTFKRETKFVEPIIGYCELDEKGELIANFDDCGNEYDKSKIVLSPHFRSCALYYSKIHKDVNYTPTRLSKHGFREEQIFSWKLINAGFKIGVDTKAINYHQNTPSGGERFSDSNSLISFNQKIFEEYTKELFNQKGDFIKAYYLRNGIDMDKIKNIKYKLENNLVNIK